MFSRSFVISAALKLLKVTILEKLDQIGGRARVFKKSGYTFDAGPTVITAPFLFDELFSLFKKDRKKYVKFVRLDPWYRFYFSSNEKVFDYSDSLKNTESGVLIMNEISMSQKKFSMLVF